MIYHIFGDDGHSSCGEGVIIDGPADLDLVAAYTVCRVKASSGSVSAKEFAEFLVRQCGCRYPRVGWFNVYEPWDCSQKIPSMTTDCQPFPQSVT